MVAEAPSIHVKDLTYNFPDGSAGLKDINVDLPPGSRTLLIGGMGFPSFWYFSGGSGGG
jgi:CCR4-NOT complex subunit CAF16